MGVARNAGPALLEGWLSTESGEAAASPQPRTAEKLREGISRVGFANVNTGARNSG